MADPTAAEQAAVCTRWVWRLGHHADGHECGAPATCEAFLAPGVWAPSCDRCAVRRAIVPGYTRPLERLAR